MQLNTKNDDAHRMATELSRLTGESLTQAVLTALERRLDEERRRKVAERGDLASRLAPIVARANERPALDDRPGDDILYDEDGLPK